MTLKKILPPLAVLWVFLVIGAFVYQCCRCFLPAFLAAPAIPFSYQAFIGLFFHGIKTLWVVAFILSAHGLGHRLLTWRRQTPVDHFLSVGLGLVVWSAFGLLLALLGLSGPTVLRVVFVLVALPSGWWAVKVLRTLAPPTLGNHRLFAWALAALTLFYWLAAMVPEIFGDVLHYILPSAQAYIREGRWTVIPGISSMGFPAAAATLYVWPLSWADERLAKLLNWAIGVLWVAAVGVWAGKRWGKEAGLWSSVFMAANPLFGLYVWSATAEILCGLLVFLSFTRWEEKKPNVALAFLLLGAAAAVKYTALLLLPFFVIDGLRRVRRREWPAGWLGRGLVVVLVPLLPWWLLNLHAYGNPFFPYFTDWFGPGTPAEQSLWSMMLADQRGPWGLGARFWRFFAASLRGMWEGRAGFTGFLPLLLLPGLAALGRRPREGSRPGHRLAWALIAVCIFFCFTTGRPRFFLPFLGLLCAAAGPAAGWFLTRAGDFARAGRWLAGTGLAVQAACLALILHAFNDGFSVITGGERAADFVKRPHGAGYPAPPAGGYEWLEKNAAPADKVYILGEHRVFRVPIAAHANTLYDVPLYVTALESGLDAAQFLKALRREGFTHLLFNRGFFMGAVAGQYTTLEWTRRLDAVFGLLPPPLYQDDWAVVFAIPPSIN